MEGDEEGGESDLDVNAEPNGAASILQEKTCL